MPVRHQNLVPAQHCTAHRPPLTATHGCCACNIYMGACPPLRAEFARCLGPQGPPPWEQAEATWALLPPYSFESPDRVAQAASALVARCQQLYKLGYFTKFRWEGRLKLDVLLIVLASNQVQA